MKRLILISLILSLAMFSCSENRKELKLIKVTELSSSKVSDTALVSLLQKNIGREIKIQYTLSEDSALKYLNEKKVDLAILPNNTMINDNDLDIRTIVPLLPRMLVILKYNIPGQSQMSLKELFENHTVIYEDLSRLDSIFFHKLFVSYNINSKNINGYNVNQINLDDWEDKSFVFVGLTHLHNPIMARLIDQGAVFQGLDDVENLGRGSSAEGFVLDFPSASTFIFPKSFYHGKPDKPILTVSITDVLVCREELDKSTVYMIVENVVENKAHLIQDDNIYTMLQTDFNALDVTFPYHSGTKAYLERDKPPIWSRYASIIWPFISMLAILTGLFASFKNRLKQRQKHRIETYYQALLRIRSRALEDRSKTKDLLKSLGKIRVDAFNALSKNKLVANESFSIFLTLYSDIKDEITDHYNSEKEHDE